MRALEAGDRPQFLELQFAQATDPLTEASYRAFRKLCSAAEWQVYEPRVLEALQEVHEEHRLLIHLARKENDLALAILSRMRCPRGWYGGDSVLRAASRLEARYSREILAFYGSGLGKLNVTGTRKEYACNARIVMKMRHLWLNVLRQPEQWLAG